VRSMIAPVIGVVALRLLDHRAPLYHRWLHG
jgi:hypothetical protein